MGECSSYFSTLNYRVFVDTNFFGVHNRQDPAFFLLWFLPFVAPIAMLVTALRFSRILPYVGLGSTLFLAAIAIADLSRTPGIALGEIALAICMALTTIAAMAGRRRSVATGL